MDGFHWFLVNFFWKIPAPLQKQTFLWLDSPSPTLFPSHINEDVLIRFREVSSLSVYIVWHFLSSYRSLVVNILWGKGAICFPAFLSCPCSFQIQKVHDCDQTIKNKICLQAIRSIILGIRCWQLWSIGQKKTQRKEQKTAPLSSFHKSFIMCRWNFMP